MDPGGLWFGVIAFFVLPTALFVWSVFSKKGRSTYERTVENSRRLARGLPPLPPRTRLGRWSEEHPWLASALLGVAAVGLLTVVGIVFFGAGLDEAFGRAIPLGLQAYLIHTLARAFLARRGRPPPNG